MKKLCFLEFNWVMAHKPATLSPPPLPPSPPPNPFALTTLLVGWVWTFVSFPFHLLLYVFYIFDNILASCCIL